MPSPASARALANSIEFGIQPGFAVWGEDNQVDMFNYSYNFKRWEAVVPYLQAGVGFFNNYTGAVDDDGAAINLGGGVRWFPSQWPVYVGLDLRLVGLFGDVNDTANGIVGLALGATLDLNKLFGR